jgi:hypothetical protein
MLVPPGAGAGPRIGTAAPGKEYDRGALPGPRRVRRARSVATPCFSRHVPASAVRHPPFLEAHVAQTLTDGGGPCAAALLPAMATRALPEPRLQPDEERSASQVRDRGRAARGRPGGAGP